MEFSELFKSSNIIQFSPDNKYIANIYNFRLCIRDSQTLQIKKYFTCLDICSKIEWSHNSRFILCLQEKRNLVQIFDIEQDTSFDLHQGVAGAANARFVRVESSSDAFVLVHADFQLRISIWRISPEGKLTFVTHIKMPKFDERGLDFNKMNNRMAILERKDGQDYITIYNCGDGEFSPICHFSIKTNNAVDLKWSADSEYICAWDSLLSYSVHIYRPDGELVKKYIAYEDALGLKSVMWSPVAPLLALGSYDNCIRLFDVESKQIIAELSHDALVSQINVPVFKETPIGSLSFSGQDHIETRYEVYQTPMKLQSVGVQYDRPNPKVGIGLLAFSPCGRYLISKNDSIPTALYIWDLTKLSLFSILVQLQPITSVSWKPTIAVNNDDETQRQLISGINQPIQLCLVTGGDKMYLWSDEGCSCVDIPAEDFAVGKILWCDNGSVAALIGRDSMCCCYPSSNVEE